MTQVTGTITKPNGAPAIGGFVRISPVGVSRLFVSADDETIVGTLDVALDVNGDFTVDLPGTTQTNPTNSRWSIEAHAPGYPGGVVEQIIVPDAGGPYTYEDLLATDPLDLEFPGGLVDVADLPAATFPFDGAEQVPMLQDGVAVRASADQLAGGPLENLNGSTRTRIRGFTDLETFTAAVTANGAIIPGTPMTSAVAGTGAQIAQGATLGEYGVADLTKGTTAAGRAGMVSQYPALFLFDETARIAVGARIRLPTTVSDGTDTYRVQVGIGDMTTLTPTDAAILIRSPAAAGNWQGLIYDDGALVDTTDLGVATDHAGLGSSWHVFVVEYTPEFGVRYFVDGNVVGTEATIQPDVLANLGTWGVGIIGVAGTANRIAEVDGVSFDMSVGLNRWANMP